MSTPNQPPATSDEQQNPSKSSGSAGGPRGVFGRLFEAARKSQTKQSAPVLVPRFNDFKANIQACGDKAKKFASRFGEASVKDVEKILDEVEAPKNIAKANREEIHAKNAIKVLCKGFSFGSYTSALSKIHTDNLPLRNNLLCDQCNIKTDTGVVEVGKERGKLVNKDRHEDLSISVAQFRQHLWSIEDYEKQIAGMYEVDGLCRAHRELKSKNLTRCPKGSIFKPYTMRSTLYKNSVLNANNSHGGHIDRLITQFLTLDPTKAHELSEVDAIVRLLCYLPTPFNRLIDVLLLYMDIKFHGFLGEVLITPNALRQFRIALAREQSFSDEFWDWFKVNNPAFTLVRVDPENEADLYLRVKSLTKEEFEAASKRAYSVNLQEDELPAAVPKTDFDLADDENFPTLNAAIERDRLKRDAIFAERLKKVEAIVAKRKVAQQRHQAKPISRRFGSTKNKYFGYVQLDVVDNPNASSKQTKTIIVGQPGKWDMTQPVRGVAELISFTGRADLNSSKQKRAKFLRSLILNQSAKEDFVKVTEKVNSQQNPPIFPTTNVFGALTEVDIGGGKGAPEKKPYHVNTVTKGDKGVTSKITKVMLAEKLADLEQVSVPGDGDCFFHCLNSHGVETDRQLWRQRFIELGKNAKTNEEWIDSFSDDEFKKGEWVTGSVWAHAMNQWFANEKVKMRINVIYYSDLTKTFNCMMSVYRSPVVNIIYNMDTKNHYDFVYSPTITKPYIPDSWGVSKCDIFNHKGIRDCDYFVKQHAEAEKLVIVKQHLEMEIAKCSSDFKVAYKNGIIDFTYTDNHDKNVEFVTAWNKVRANFPDDMKKAQITQPTSAVDGMFSSPTGACLGGKDERAEKEKRLNEALRNTGPHDEEEEKREEEAFIKKKKEKFPMADYKIFPVEYSPSTQYSIRTFTSSIAEEIWKKNENKIRYEQMLSNEPATFEYIGSFQGKKGYPLLGAVREFSDFLNEVTLSTSHLVTYGRVLDYFRPVYELGVDNPDWMKQSGDYLAIENNLCLGTFAKTLADLYKYYDDIQGFTFKGSDLRMEGKDGGYIIVNEGTVDSEWIVWQRANYASASSYLTSLTAACQSFFDSFSFVGDLFSSILDLFDEICYDKFRIKLPADGSISGEILTLMQNLEDHKDQRSLRDLMSKVKRNPMLCKMEISHYDLVEPDGYLQYVKQYFVHKEFSCTFQPPNSNQWNTHERIIDLLHGVARGSFSPFVVTVICGIMNFVNRFIYPLTVENVDVKTFSLSALSETMASPAIRNALKGTKKFADLHLKLTNFSNNFAAINYSVVKDSFGNDLTAGNLFCSAVFLKHLDLMNKDLTTAVTAEQSDHFRSFQGFKGGGSLRRRRLGYGVYCGDAHANHIIFKTESNEEIWAREISDPHNLRTPILVELPYSIGYHFPHMDTSADNLALGCTNRALRYQREYPMCALRFMQKHIDWRFQNLLLLPIEPGEVLTLEEYLERTSYTEAQKNTIRDAWRKFCEEHKLEINCNIFVKDESYDLFKAPRQIFSTTEMMKAIVAPLVRTAEKRFFGQIDYHVKGLTNKERLKKLLSMEYVETIHELFGSDWSAMEKHVTPMCHRAQNYFLSCLYANNPHVNHTLEIAMSSVGVRSGYSKNKAHIVDFTSKMASGDSKTAFYNFLLNDFFGDMLKFAFYCRQRYLRQYSLSKNVCIDFNAADTKWQDLEWFEDWATEPGNMDATKSLYTVKEGDDELSVVPMGLPDWAPVFYSQLHVDVKTVKFSSLSTASFCGIIAGDDGQLLRDGIKTIIKMGSTNTRYMWSKEAKLAALMRLKAECMLHDYSACPILFAYCIRVMNQIDQDHGLLNMERNEVMKMLRTEMSSWEWERFVENLENTNNLVSYPTYNTRLAYERAFGISPDEQIHLENKILTGTWVEIKDAISIFVPLEAKLYTSRYVLDEPLHHGCVAEVFVPEAIRFKLGVDSHYEAYRRFEATNHDAYSEPFLLLWA